MAEPADLNLDELKRRGRRRLIGAVVLALVAAVVVPMLLESDPKPLGEDVSVRIPPVDDGKFVTKLPDQAPRKSLADAEKSVLTPGSRPAPSVESKVAAAPAPAKAVTPPAAAVPTPASAPAATKAAEPVAPPPKVEASKAEAPKDGGFVVQLAAFSDDKGANALSGKLKRGGYPAYTESLTTSKGTLWRVRVGPYPSREAAGQSRDRLKGEGHAGIVVPSK